MDRWIRWTTKEGTSLWHRAVVGVPPGRKQRGSSQAGAARSPEFVESLSVTGASTYRRTACGFVVPPYGRIELSVGLPPHPRCIWCHHGWTVDIAPPSGAPPLPTGGGPRRVVIRVQGKKPPTQHA